MFGDRCTCLLFVSCWFQQYCTHSCFSATYKAEEDLPTVVDRYTCRTPHFHMYSHSTDHSTDDMCSGLKELAGLKFELRHQKSLHPRVMFHLAPQSTLNTSTSSLSSTSSVLHSSTSPTTDLLFTRPYTHCKDPRQDGTSTEYQPLTTVVCTMSSRKMRVAKELKAAQDGEDHLHRACCQL